MTRGTRLLLSLLCCIAATGALAQEQPTPPATVEVRAGDAQNVVVSAAATFDASESILPGDANPTFTWSFGDGDEETGERVTHTYRRIGTYHVRLTVTSERYGTHEDSTSVRVFRLEHLLLTDRPADGPQVTALVDRAAEEDILITVLRPSPGSPTVDESLARQAVDDQQQIGRIPLLFIWMSGTAGSDTLSNIGQLITALGPETRRTIHMEEKGVILLTDQPLGFIARPAQTAFNVLRPQYVVLARPDVLSFLSAAHTADEALNAIRTSETPFRILGTHSERAVSSLTPWNALSYVVNGLVNAGVPTSSIVLILMLPIVATLLAFSRQVLGVKAFGIFTPAAVTLSFLALGLKYGLFVFVAVLFAATASRLVLHRFRLLYLPRMAMVLTAVSFAVLVLFGVAAMFGDTGILAFSVFPILLLASLAEQFVEAQIRLGFRTAARLTMETLLLSVIATLIVSWDTLRSLVVGVPELILLTIPFNILLGRWTGLRVNEYFRFRSLLFPSRPPR